MLHGFLGFCKKVKALAKQKDCELVGKWEQSMINHMYWCVVSTPNGDGDMMVAKWLSLENHIHNKHSGPQPTLSEVLSWKACWKKPKQEVV